MTITDDQASTRERRAPSARKADGTRVRSAAAQRALDKRRKRLGSETVSERSARGARVRSVPVEKDKANPRSVVGVTFAPLRAARRVPFAVVVVAMLLAGLALTLWLSTKSAQDSYQLGVVREQNEQLSDRRDALKKAYESGDSAPELSDKAGALGMIPGNDKARLVVGPDGKSFVVGEVKPADGPKAPSMNDAPAASPRTPTTSGRPSTTPMPGVQGTPIGAGTTPEATTPNPATQVQPAPDGQTPANPAAPPTFSNVLPSTGGAPGSNSGQTR
ncbi:hypothetical protein [Williamsia soli]|uniref:hypothetical protein n=1 Tax=Williamsia soli TaxID=364929 RepID=UPI001F1B680C|nr:hypothetical protein [Williamsia soli]